MDSTKRRKSLLSQSSYSSEEIAKFYKKIKSMKKLIRKLKHELADLAKKKEQQDEEKRIENEKEKMKLEKARIQHADYDEEIMNLAFANMDAVNHELEALKGLNRKPKLLVNKLETVASDLQQVGQDEARSVDSIMKLVGFLGELEKELEEHEGMFSMTTIYTSNETRINKEKKQTIQFVNSENDAIGNYGNVISDTYTRTNIEKIYTHSPKLSENRIAFSANPQISPRQPSFIRQNPIPRELMNTLPFVSSYQTEVATESETTEEESEYYYDYNPTENQMLYVSSSSEESSEDEVVYGKKLNLELMDTDALGYNAIAVMTAKHLVENIMFNIMKHPKVIRFFKVQLVGLTLSMLIILFVCCYTESFDENTCYIFLGFIISALIFIIATHIYWKYFYTNKFKTIRIFEQWEYYYNIITFIVMLLIYLAIFSYFAVMDGYKVPIYRHKSLLFYILVLILGYLLSSQPNMIALDIIINNLLLQFVLAYALIKSTKLVDYMAQFLENEIDAYIKINYKILTYIINIDPLQCPLIFWSMLIISGHIHTAICYQSGIMHIVGSLLGLLLRPILRINLVECCLAVMSGCESTIALMQLLGNMSSSLTESEFQLILTLGLSGLSIPYTLIMKTLGFPFSLIIKINIINIPAVIAVSKMISPEISKTIIGNNILKVPVAKHEYTRYFILKRMIMGIYEGGLIGFRILSSVFVSGVLGSMITNTVTSILDIFSSNLDLTNNIKPTIQQVNFHSQSKDFTITRLIAWIIYPIIWLVGFYPNECLQVGQILSDSVITSNLQASSDLSEMMHSRWITDCYLENMEDYYDLANRRLRKEDKDIFLYENKNLYAKIKGPHMSARTEFMILPLLTLNINVGNLIVISCLLLIPKKKDTVKIISYIGRASLSALLACMLTTCLLGYFYDNSNEIKCAYTAKNGIFECDWWITKYEETVEKATKTKYENMNFRYDKEVKLYYLNSLCYYQMEINQTSTSVQRELIMGTKDLIRKGFIKSLCVSETVKVKH